MLPEEIDRRLAALKAAGLTRRGMPDAEFRLVAGEELYQASRERDERQREQDEATRRARLEPVERARAQREAERERQIREFAGSFVGPVSWRHLAILGVLPEVAALVRGVTQKGAKENLRVQRQRLRDEGWVFPVAVMAGSTMVLPAVPPAISGGGHVATGANLGDEARRRTDWRGIRRSVSAAQHAQYVRELAEAKQKSTWGSRLPASAR